jgi:putative SOS response-associated peptidase YedK
MAARQVGDERDFHHCYYWAQQVRAEFHNRMPLVLEPEIWDLWLKGEPDAAAELMKPANDDALVGRPVSKAVGNVKNNTPDLLA